MQSVFSETSQHTIPQPDMLKIAKTKIDKLPRGQLNESISPFQAAIGQTQNLQNGTHCWSSAVFFTA